MRQRLLLVGMLAVFVLVLGTTRAYAQPPAGPTVRHQYRVDGPPLSGPYDIVQQTLHFAPGAATPWHTHPGQVLVTVVEGELTFRSHTSEQVHKTGDSFAEMAGHVQQAHNTSAANTTVVASFILPDGAPLSTPEPGDTTPLPRPVAGWQIRTDAMAPPTPYEVLQVVLDFAPGAATPWHTHPGQLLVTVLEGEITFNVNNTDHVYKAGDSFVELPTEVAQARNATSARTAVLGTTLVPKGAPLSHPVTAAAPAPAPAAPAHESMPQPVALPNTGTTRWFLPLMVVAAVLVCSGAAIRARYIRRTRSIESARPSVSR